MELYPMLVDAQIVLIVITLVIWAKKDVVAEWERRIRRMVKRRRKGVIRCSDGKVVGERIAPAMTAEEIVKVCNSL